MSFGILKDTESFANNEKNSEKNIMNKLNLNEIIQVNFPTNQYVREQTNKTQICIHHTVSGPDANSVARWWLNTPERIATAMIVDKYGKIYQAFSTKYWAYHLGIKTAENIPRNKGSIGVELVSWGGLVENKGKWYPAIWDKQFGRYLPNLKMKPIENVQILDKKFRDFQAFERYSVEQIESLRKLLIFWNERFNIPLTYNPSMWDISGDALSGKSGVWSHVSYRKDKSDCYPDEKLIKMLKSL